MNELVLDNPIRCDLCGGNHFFNECPQRPPSAVLYLPRVTKVFVNVSNPQRQQVQVVVNVVD
jgi:hypothetical protein